MITSRILMLASTLLLATGVMLGAFGAHALRDRLPAADLEIYNKAVLYQLIHALGIGMVALLGMTQLDLQPACIRPGCTCVVNIS